MSNTTTVTISRQLLCALIRFEQPLALIGLYWVGNSLLHNMSLRILSGLRYYLLAQWFPRRDYRHFGRWALVTLEPNTLSYYYAEELANKHMDIQLVGHASDREHLQQFANHLVRKYSIEVHVLEVAPNQDTSGTMDSILDKVDKLDSIGVLVNQLPVRPLSSPFTLLSDCELSEPIRSLVFITSLTKVVIHKMLQKRSGVIVNISDPSGDYPHPYLPIHSASCVYLDYFSRSLQWELSCRNIHVQYLAPYPSNHLESDRCSLGSIRDLVVAKHAVNAIGKYRSRGYWLYGLRCFLASFLPCCLRQYVSYLWNRPECDCQPDLE